MEITSFFKCSCANCGKIIEYLASDAGKVVECPQCKEKSQLPESEKLLMVEIEGPPLPATKNCLVCGAEMKFLDEDCAQCEAMHEKKLRRIWTLVSVSVLVLAGVVWLCLRHYSKLAAAETAANSKEQGKVMLAQPQTRLPKSINDLKPGRFSLEQRRGSDLMMAVGDIENDSENVHHGLRADLDLLDAAGAKIGTLTDYATELGPHQSWHFLAQVTNPKVASVKFATIKEDQ